MDADLVMLSMECKFANIILIREDYSDVRNITNLRKEIIDKLSCNNFNGFNSAKEETDPVIKNKLIIRDFIIMVFLLGNDFLPNFVALYEVDESMGILIDVYKLNKCVNMSDIDGQINYKALANFFAQISLEEPRLIKEKAEIK